MGFYLLNMPSRKDTVCSRAYTRRLSQIDLVPEVQLTKHRTLLMSIMLGCIAFVGLAGCVTAPASLIELGAEQPGPRVSGDALYVGWYGVSLNGRTKPEAFESAVSQASEIALEQGYSPTLENTRLWTTT